MAKGDAKTVFTCNDCGATNPKWVGQCPKCGHWDTMEEQLVNPTAAPAKAGRGNWASGGGKAGSPTQNLGALAQGQRAVRHPTGLAEFDRVLGGVGGVEGSIVLIGGDPGIGKSTLLLQVAAFMGEHADVTYVTGEESLHQVSDRALRLKLDPARIDGLTEVEVTTILDTLYSSRPRVAIIDSIQTLYDERLTSAAGSVSQVKACTGMLTRFAKETGCIVFLVGHVTKSGDIAGPRVLEHMVDAVLYFEGDEQSPYRLLRAIKNRFGAANELGAFEMTGEGLVSVDNPSAMFLSEDRQLSSGSCVFVLQDGPRPIMIEIQALMDDAVGAQPQRRAVGVDPNRMAMLLAILHKHANMDVGTFDVFLNAVGGIKAFETAADLPMLLAMVSSLTDKALPTDLACFGEVGLNGEVRPVQRAEDRLREMAKLGQTVAIVPARNVPKKAIPGLRVIPVRDIAQAIGEIKELWVPVNQPNAEAGARASRPSERGGSRSRSR